MARSGAENDVVRLCRALNTRGWQIHVCCKTGSAESDFALHFTLNNPEKTVQEVKPAATVDWGMFHPADIHRLGGGIHKEFQKYNLLSTAGIARCIKKLSLIKKKHRVQVKAENEILKAERAHFLAISEMVAKHAVMNGARKERTHVLYNGLDLEQFKPGIALEARQGIRKKWGVGKDEVLFLFVAHNLKLKNLNLMQKCFDRLHKTFPQMRLVVCGKREPSRKPYTIYAGLSDCMEEIYGGCDVLVHPTFFDSFGNVIVEAMACELPVIVSELAGASELIESSKNGVVLPVQGRGVRELWQKEIIAMLNKEQRMKLGKKGRDSLSRLHYPDYVGEFENYIRTVINKQERHNNG